MGLVLLLISFGWIMYSASWHLHRSHYQCEHFADIPKYLGGAKGLATIGAYRDPTTVGVPPMTHYPPANSAFLSLFFLKSSPIDEQLDSAAMGMAAIHCIAALLVFLILRKAGVNPIIVGLSSLLLATSPQWLVHVSKFMSDPLFSTLAFIAAWNLLSLPGKPSIGYGVFMGILGSCLILTRTAGLPFAFVIGLWSLNQLWKTRKVGWLLPGTILAASLIGWVLFARQGFSYSNDMADRYQGFGGIGSSLPWIIRQGFEFLYLEDLSEAYPTAIYNWLSVRPPPWQWIMPTAGLAVTCLCIVGIRARRSASDLWAGLAVGLYGIQIALWPFPLGARCAMPLLPWVAVWSWAGLQSVTKSASSLRIVTGMIAFALSVGVLTNMWVCRSVARLSLQRSSTSELDDIVQWLSRHASPKEVIGSYLGIPRVQFSENLGRPLELFRNEIIRPVTEGPAGMEGAHMTNMTDWLIFSSEDQPLMSTISNSYPVVYSSGKWEVRRRSSSGTAP